MKTFFFFADKSATFIKYQRKMLLEENVIKTYKKTPAKQKG